MTLKIKLFARLLMLAVLFSLMSCNEELYEETIHSSKKIKLTEVKFKELVKDENFSILLSSINSNNISARSVFEIQYGFTISRDVVKIIETDTVTSYTMLIEREGVNDSSYFENLVVQMDIYNNQKAAIFKYIPTNISASADNSFIFNGTIEKSNLVFFSSNKNSLQKTTQNECFADQLMCNQSWSGGLGSSHHAGRYCTNIRYLYLRRVKVLCDATIPGDGGGGGGDFGTGGLGDGFTPGGGSPSGNNPPTAPQDYEIPEIITSPVLNTQNSDEIRNINLFYQSLTLQQLQWVSENQTNQITYNQIVQYQIDNKWSSDSKIFANDYINVLINNPQTTYTMTNYPGMNDGKPFEWWKDIDYIANNLKIIPDSNAPAETPNILEIILFTQYPAQALIHIKNSTDALAFAQATLLPRLHNGKADAFRHAYWNARDTADIGKNLTLLFTTAHEWNSGNHALETQMDLFNNGQGRDIGQNYNIFTPNSVIQTQIINAIILGTLKYLTPLDSSPQDDGIIINGETQIKWTNQ